MPIGEPTMPTPEEIAQRAKDSRNIEDTQDTGLPKDVSSRELTRDEQDEIEQKRRAYARAVEGGGIKGRVKEIIGTIQGGKLSKKGEVSAYLDAKREDRTRRLAKMSLKPLGTDAPLFDTDAHLKKTQDAYFMPDATDHFFLSTFPDGFEGVINGQDVKIKRIGEGKFARYTGEIDGVKISQDEAKEIYWAYEEIAMEQKYDHERSSVPPLPFKD